MKEDYTNISKATIRNFFNRITNMPVGKREKEYDEHIDIVRAYLVSLGVDSAYFDMVTVNEAIREHLMGYIKAPGILFKEDGIYQGTGNSQEKVFGIMSTSEISTATELLTKPKNKDKQEAEGKDKGSSELVVNTILIQSINDIMTKGIEEVDIEKKILKRSTQYYPYDKVLFLTPEFFITKVKKGKPKDKKDEGNSEKKETSADKFGIEAEKDKKRRIRL